MQPQLPFEFLVQGTAVSAQSHSARSRAEWQSTVQQAARYAMPEGAWLIECRLAASVFILPAAEMQGDVDNRAKPILDAMKGCVYMDDSQIDRLLIRKIEPGFSPEFTISTELLDIALDIGMHTPLVYIHISDDLGKEAV